MTAIKGDKGRGQYCKPLSLIDNMTEYYDLDRLFLPVLWISLNVRKHNRLIFSFMQISLCLGTKLYDLIYPF